MEREINQGKSLSENRIEKPERLSDEQLGNLISAVGNHEAKALTLLLMKTGSLYSKPDLFNAFIEKQGQSPGWIPNVSVPFGYCVNSLASIGLVAKEYIDENLNTYGFIKTEYGDKIGVPFAGLMLDLSERYPSFSLINIFGRTASPSLSLKTIETSEGHQSQYKIRTPIIQHAIFQELLTSDLPMRATDLARSLSRVNKFTINQISPHLSQMSKDGIITYHSYIADNPYVFYSLTDKSSSFSKDVKRDIALTEYIYEILCNHRLNHISAQQIIAELLQRHTELKTVSEKNLKSRVSGILGGFFTKNGYVSKEKFGSDSHSEIDLTEEQRSMLIDLVDSIDRFQQQDPAILEKGIKKAEEIIMDPHRVLNSLHKVRTFSTHVNSTSINTTCSRILTILQGKKNFTNREISDSLRSEYGQNINPRSVSELTKFLVQKNLITNFRKGSCYYTLLIKENQQKD